MLLPVLSLGHAAYLAFLNPNDTTGIFRRAFLAGGAVLLLLPFAGVVQLFGHEFSAGPETLDVAIRAAFGMLVAALVCAVVERRRNQGRG